MRSEKTLYDLILSFARHNDAIRAVWMNGSRANPNAPKDILQDFDIVYAVTDIGPFRKKPRLDRPVRQTAHGTGTRQPDAGRGQRQTRRKIHLADAL